MQPLITVIMPTYNSEKTIEKALASIRMQTLPMEQVEILVVDGGSTDATRTIATRYGAIILENPYRLPEPAKWLGLQRANGRYAMWQDSDEELIKPDQLASRLTFLSQNPQVKCMVCDEQAPGHRCGVSARYLCVCGDPFTQFIYRRKNGVVATFSKAVAQQSKQGCLLRFEPGDLTPIGDGGTTLFDLMWVKEAYPAVWNTQAFACAVFGNICETTRCCGCIPQDNILHHARAKFKMYLSKLRFRIINNIFHPESSGYGARVDQLRSAKLIRRKQWFVVYALTLAGPIFTSLRLALRYKDPGMLLHFFYVYYVCAYALICMVKKATGKTLSNIGYGKG